MRRVCQLLLAKSATPSRLVADRHRPRLSTLRCIKAQTLDGYPDTTLPIRSRYSNTHSRRGYYLGFWNVSKPTQKLRMEKVSEIRKLSRSEGCHPEAARSSHNQPLRLLCCWSAEWSECLNRFNFICRWWVNHFCLFMRWILTAKEIYTIPKSTRTGYFKGVWRLRRTPGTF